MNGFAWACVEAAAGMLEPREREIALGDLAEFEVGFWRGLWDVLGLALRRQAALWRSWRPWVASVALAWPGSLFLMGNSVAISGALLHGGQWKEGLWRLGRLTIWALAAGYAAGAISRKTIWASALAFLLPCCFCLSLWPGSWLGATRLLLFVAPAFVGAWLGLRRERLVREWAMLASMAALLAAPLTGGVRLQHLQWYEAGVLWPAIYLYWIGFKAIKRRGRGAGLNVDSA